MVLGPVDQNLAAGPGLRAADVGDQVAVRGGQPLPDRLRIRDGVVELDGSVDGEEDRRHLIALLRGVKGLRDLKAEGLLARGVDSHLPRDADE